MFENEAVKYFASMRVMCIILLQYTYILICRTLYLLCDMKYDMTKDTHTHTKKAQSEGQSSSQASINVLLM